MSKADENLDTGHEPDGEDSAQARPTPGTQQFVPGLGRVTVGDPNAHNSHSAAEEVFSEGSDLSKETEKTEDQKAADSSPLPQAPESTQEARETTDQGGAAAAPSSETETEIDPLSAELGQAQEKRISELKDEVARSNAAYYNLDQEYSAYVRRSKAEIPTHRQNGINEVINALLGVLDDIALARQHGDLDGTFKAVATKLEDTLETKFQIVRFGEVGQEFDPELHQAIQMMDGEGEDTVIVQVAQPGYLQGDKVLRPAMVIAGHGKTTVEPTVLPGGENSGKEGK